MSEPLEIRINKNGDVEIPWTHDNDVELVDYLKQVLGIDRTRIRVLFGQTYCG